MFFTDTQQSGRFARRWRFETSAGPGEAIARIAETASDGLAYSSVVPAWTEALRAMGPEGLAGRIVEAGHRSELPFTLSVEEPEAVGPDRLCAAAGAWAEGAREAVVVDAGTAVTVDLISGGSFRGGSIFPGHALLALSLHRGTALLPLIGERTAIGTPPGGSTSKAIAAGIGWGLVGAVKELVSRTLPEGGDLWVTGGDGEVLAPHLDRSFRFDPDLVFKGLLSMLSDG